MFAGPIVLGCRPIREYDDGTTGHPTYAQAFALVRQRYSKRMARVYTRWRGHDKNRLHAVRITAAGGGHEDPGCGRPSTDTRSAPAGAARPRSRHRAAGSP